jgi:hypothetical protein
MYSRPRGICQGCGKDHALNLNGWIMAHARYGRRGSPYNPEPWCDGVGKPPRATVEAGRVGTQTPLAAAHDPIEQEAAPMSVIAKFYVREITRYSYNPASVTVKLGPVTRGEENKSWAAATPTGDITLGIQNELASRQFELGEEYLITFEHAPKGGGHDLG